MFIRQQAEMRWVIHPCDSGKAAQNEPDHHGKLSVRQDLISPARSSRLLLPIPMGQNQYSQEDVQQILQVAIARQTHEQDDLSRVQLMEIADEMGISLQELDEAEQMWLQQRDQLGLVQQFDQYRQQRFKQSGTKYLIVNGFLVVFDLMVGGGLGFSLYVIVGWGLGLAMQGRQTYGLKGEEYERRFQTWRRKRALKQSVDGLVSRILPGS